MRVPHNVKRWISLQRQDLSWTCSYSENVWLSWLIFSRCLSNAQFGSSRFPRLVSTLITSLATCPLHQTSYFQLWVSVGGNAFLPVTPGDICLAVLQWGSGMLSVLSSETLSCFVPSPMRNKGHQCSRFRASVYIWVCMFMLSITPSSLPGINPPYLSRGHTLFLWWHHVGRVDGAARARPGLFISFRLKAEKKHLPPFSCPLLLCCLDFI